MPSPIRKVVFRDFKGFRRYSVSLQQTNILVGANNAGKSTVISAFRILELGLRKARARKPERILFKNEAVFGYRIDLDDLDVSTENVHTDYDEVDSSIEFSVENGSTLTLHFPSNGGCFMLAEASGIYIASPKAFHREFPLPMVVVPVLAPLEHDEDFVSSATVNRNLGTSRASRNFRSYWMYYPDGFQRYAELIEATWPEMTIRRPEETENIVRMYCLERRMTRELYWSGFGFQIWCQLIAHISRAVPGSLVVIDEPDVYLHPDVQRQILPLLDRLGLSVLTATHATEIIAQAEPNEILSIDKNHRAARRLKDFKEVQLVLDEIGSVQNLSLSRLARYGRIVFFEGQDIKILQRLAKRAGVSLTDFGSKVSIIEAGGFQSWKRIRDFLWGAKRLDLSLNVAAVFDRDYFPDAAIAEVVQELTSEGCVTHVHERKELENYLLESEAILTALKKYWPKDSVLEAPTTSTIDAWLSEACEEVKEQVFTQTFAKSLEGAAAKLDIATLLKNERVQFEMNWRSKAWMFAHVSGKEVLKLVRKKMQEDYKISLNNTAIAEVIKQDKIPPDLLQLFAKLQEFFSVTP